jgi:Barstar (barnase inhibitor)
MSDGVRSLPMNEDVVRGIEALAGAVGWPCFVVDLAGCDDKPELLRRVSVALAFPDWFGHNWDAFFDCLVDLGWQPRAGGYVVLLRHVTELRAAAPEALDTAFAICDDAARVWGERGVQFRVLADECSAAAA